MRKEHLTIVALAVWLTIISVILLLAQSVDIEIFFVLSFIGFVIVVGLISTKFIHPIYRRFINYILAVAIMIFGLIVAQKVMEILGLEIIFS